MFFSFKLPNLVQVVAKQQLQTGNGKQEMTIFIFYSQIATFTFKIEKLLNFMFR